MIEVTQLFQAKRTHVKRYNATIALTYVAFSIVVLIEIYLASLSPGTAPGEFASMNVFP